MLKKEILFLYLALLIILTPIIAFSQGGSDIFLIRLKLAEGKYIFSESVKISTIDGYNNQPSFHPDGNSLFYSAGIGQNTDIYRYDIKSGKTARVTNTPDAEYSPIVMPGGEKFSVIQLVISEGQRKGAQPLIAFPLTGGESELIHEDGKKVGYHAWIDSRKVAMFILGSPNSLQIVDVKTQSSLRIEDGIGRSIYLVPGQEAISFSQSGEDGPEIIKSYDLKLKTIKSLAPMLKGNGFYAWTPSGELIMGVGAKLFVFRPDADREWRQVADLSEHGIKNISRLAIGPRGRHLALVSSR